MDKLNRTKFYEENNGDRGIRQPTASASGAASERSSVTEFVSDIVGNAEDELAASVGADRRLERISYNTL